jgi:hypothetical protein
VIETIVIKHKGNFDKIEKFLKRASKSDYLHILEKYGREGVSALSSATPVDTGKTANSWGYEIQRFKGSAIISWTNSNVVNGVPIAIILQYGHGTQNGGYVLGRDYINPAIKPIFDKMAEDVWREVTRP